MAPKIQWPLVLFSLLAGAGGCAFFFVGIANALGEATTVTLPITVACFLLCVAGGLFSMKHLASPKHAVYALQHLFSFSGISVELIMLGLSCLSMILYWAFSSVFENETARFVTGLVGAVCGVGLAFATGHGYLISSKPTWNTPKLPIAYTSTALSLGGFAYLTLSGMMDSLPNVWRICALIQVAAACFSAVSLVSYMKHLGSRIVHSDTQIYYGIVLGGIIAPLPLAVAATAIGSGPIGVSVSIVGLCAAFAGGLCLRMLMWIAGAGFLAFFEEAQARRSVLLNC